MLYMDEKVLDVSHLKKQYGSFAAVSDISFQIQKGEVVGLLGPNGAGKTTTIQMLLGLTEPTSGNIHFFGKRFTEHREEILTRINFVSAYSNMQTRTTVWQNLHVFSLLYRVQDWETKAKVLSEQLGVTDKFHMLYWHLSSGERARVNLVKAFLNDPDLLLMDEPTASLDPEIVGVVLDLIDQMRKKRNISILFTSHNMGEVSRICDRVIFLHHGQIIATDTPSGLARQVAKTTLRLAFDGAVKKVEQYLKKSHFTYEMKYAQRVSILLDEKDVPTVLFGLSEAGIWITDIEIEKPNLEDVFLAVAKGGKHAFMEN